MRISSADRHSRIIKKPIQISGTPLKIGCVPLQDPPQALEIVKTYSRRPRNKTIAAQFLKAPSFSLLLFAVGLDVRQFQSLVSALPRSSQLREFFADFPLMCTLSVSPPKELANWTKYSTLWTIFQSTETANNGARVQGTEPIRELYTKAALLPAYLRNIAMQIILRFQLGNMHFIKTYPRFLRNKNSTREDYEGKIRRMADWFTLNPHTFAQLLFMQPTQISDIELCEKIYLNCQNFVWLGGTASQYVTALKDLGTTFGSTRFHSKDWKDRQADLRKTFGTRLSEQRLKKAISKSAIKKVFSILRLKGRVREAEILRFMALTGQRNIDYWKFVPADIFIDFKAKIIKITWQWGKTRSAKLPHQLTMHPFGRTGTFFDLLTCVQTLLELKPQRAIYLLRTTCAHSTFLRKAFAELPENERPECLSKISPYFFKNVLARCCLETKVAAEVASHYLKHTLSDAEWKNLCSHSHVNLSKVSANYAIAENLVPHIDKCFAPWWNN